MKQKEDSKTLGKGKGQSGQRSSNGGRVRAVLDGATLNPPPIWMMRQAGRYLPEYKALRSEAKGFLDLCYDPVRAAEVTLQPVTRFDVDAAILFSDILVIPHALGRRVDFVEGEGPRLNPIDARAIERLEANFVVERLRPVLDTVASVRAHLSPEKTLIGFCGAPWTVATYMIAGRGTPDQAPALAFARKNPDAMQALVDVLVDASAEYLVAQIRAGADVVQIFDTWAGVLDAEGFERWSVVPTAEIVRAVKANEPDARIIGFPKGVSPQRLEHYIAATEVDGISLGSDVPLVFAHDHLQSRVAVQGNLDPKVLVAGGGAQDAAVDAILDELDGGRFIFNLGHGILPETPVAHVARLVERVRSRR
jgi:uroporphyrinogen decarboxylase